MTGADPNAAIRNVDAHAEQVSEPQAKHLTLVDNDAGEELAAAINKHQEPAHPAASEAGFLADRSQRLFDELKREKGFLDEERKRLKKFDADVRTRREHLCEQMAERQAYINKLSETRESVLRHSAELDSLSRRESVEEKPKAAPKRRTKKAAAE